MKKNICVLSVSAIFMANSPILHAEDNGFYLDLSTGNIDLDFSDASLQAGAGGVPRLDFDRATLVGLSGGYSFGVWAIELEYLQSLGSADVQASNANGSVAGDFDYRDFRISGVYRSTGQLYFMGKLGMSFPDLDTDIPTLRLNMGDSVIYGVGGGYRFTDSTALELEYNRSQDDTATFSLGIRHHF